MTLLKPLDVIWIFDEMITPPGPKMIVCIEPTKGFFFHINEKPWQTGVRIMMVEHQNFLTKDSHIECGIPLEVDEYIVQGSLGRKGVVGQIREKHCQQIYLIVAASPTISSADKDLIRLALRC